MSLSHTIPIPPITIAFALLGLVQLLLIGLALSIALLITLTARRLRRPPRRSYAWAVARGVPGDPSELPEPRAFQTIQLTIDHRGSTATAWSIEADEPDAPIILYTPGWGDAKIKSLQRLHAMAPIASTIIAWDPPGHGDSPGKCALGTREPQHIRHIIENAIPPDKPIILWGHSLGAGAAIAAAAAICDNPDTARRILAVVAEAPYRLPKTPASRVMRQAGLPWTGIGPLAYIALGIRTGIGPSWPGFDRALHPRNLNHTPLLVIHGQLDNICPPDDGRDIATAAPHGTFLLIEGARHNDLWQPEFHAAPRTLQWLRAAISRP
ncbi:MAG: alpha/beta hydrolase [Phycisphaerales bacterium]